MWQGWQLRNAISAGEQPRTLVFVLTHVVGEAGEPHRTISNHDLAVSPGIDSFGVEFVHYPFISFAMVWHAKSRCPRHLVATLERAVNALPPA
jgi:hypothetical protein